MADGTRTGTGDAAASEPAADHEGHQVELRKEALTMALYVAVCLLAALAALPAGSGTPVPVLGLVWGVTLGLALAHWFAFRVAARLAGDAGLRAHDVATVSVQLAGACVVAALSTVAVLVAPGPAETELVSLVLAGTIGAAGFAVARQAGAGRVRAVAYAGVVLLLAVAVVVLKNQLSGH